MEDEEKWPCCSRLTAAMAVFMVLMKAGYSCPHPGSWVFPLLPVEGVYYRGYEERKSTGQHRGCMEKEQPDYQANKRKMKLLKALPFSFGIILGPCLADRTECGGYQIRSGFMDRFYEKEVWLAVQALSIAAALFVTYFFLLCMPVRKDLPCSISDQYHAGHIFCMAL